MFAFLLVAVVLPTMIVGHGIVPCPGGLPAPTSLSIANCPTSPCHVNVGDSIDYQVGFNIAGDSPGMDLTMFSTVFGDENQVPLPPALGNACNTMAPSCPVTHGQAVTQGASIPVSSDYHDGVPAQLRVLMTNSHNVVNMCCLINLVIH